jgi:hypothetical protein
MARTYLVTGVALTNGTIRLDAGSDLPPGRVRVIVEADTPPDGETSILDVVPGAGTRTAKQVLADIDALRDEWGDRT